MAEIGRRGGTETQRRRREKAAQARREAAEAALDEMRWSRVRFS